MTLAMMARITLLEHRGAKKITIHKVSDISIQSSFKQLTDRATIVLPRKVTFFDKNNISQVFRRGRPIVIEFGYNGNYVKEFEGYITQVSANIPVEIACEDEMWRLKQLPVNISFKNVTLQNLLQSIAPTYNINAIEGVELGAVRFANSTVAKVLDALSKSPYNLYSFMRGKQLVCGVYYGDSTEQKTVNFHLERNAVSNDLNYRNADDIILKIKGVSVLKNGSKIEAEVGNDGGDQYKLTYYNITEKSQVLRLLQKDFETKKRGGFDGSFKAFGIPSVAHGQRVFLTSDLYSDRSGTYFIEAVNKTYGASKIRQNITLGGAV